MGMKKALTRTSGHLDNWPELFKWMRGGVQNSGGTSDQSKILIFSTVLRHGTAQRIDPHRSVSRNLLILAMSVPIDRSHLLYVLEAQHVRPPPLKSADHVSSGLFKLISMEISC